MKVKSTKNLSFPKLNWGINKGQERELPKDEKEKEIILNHPAISKVVKVENNNPPKVEGEDKNKNK